MLFIASIFESVKMTKLVPVAYDGHTITFNDEAWINATEAAAKYGKTPAEWLRLPSTIEYIEAIERKYGKIPYLKTKRGSGGGTWISPKLAVNFARWLDVDFAVWCDAQIDDLIRGKTNWIGARHQASASHRLMTDMLKLTREDLGKETASHHYSNEARLVNWAFSGEFTKIERDALSRADLDLLAFLEEKNALLIGRGVDYDKRKPMLQQYALDWRLERSLQLG